MIHGEVRGVGCQVSGLIRRMDGDVFIESLSFSKCLFCNFGTAHKIHLFQPSVCVFGLLFVSPYTLPLSWSEFLPTFFF